ncbi:MAG: hypothetical protein L0H31_13080 [Nocardioidaceae bacterium]|nr:hypothetical protein [Nocardioidaceae bacterium]
MPTQWSPTATLARQPHARCLAAPKSRIGQWPTQAAHEATALMRELRVADALHRFRLAALDVDR